MQERFNKELEEIKKSQSILNNAITDIKSTLEGTNSRITEAEVIEKKKKKQLILHLKQLEERISEAKDRMVEINEIERKKRKRN